MILLIKLIGLYVTNLFSFFLQFFHPAAQDSNVNLWSDTHILWIALQYYGKVTEGRKEQDWINWH